MKTTKEIAIQIMEACKIDTSAVDENDPEFIPYIADIIKEYGKQLLIEASKRAETKINYIHDGEDVYRADIVDKSSILNIINELK